MQNAGSITCWIEQLKGGKREAAQPVWERYFTQLVRLARSRLQNVRLVVADEEDVALSALDSVYRALERGRFPQLLDRDSLWRLLVTITERKARDQLRKATRQKRGGGRVRGECALEDARPASSGPGGIEQAPAQEPDPAVAALIAEECQRLLHLLEDENLQSLALLKMEGYTNEEIAGRLNCALRTVERKLGLIRDLWEQELA